MNQGTKAAIRYFENPTQDNLEAVCQHFSKLVYHIANSKKFNRSDYPVEDRIQDGKVGLIRALRRFDPSRGLEFSTYAVPYINNEIKKAIRDSSRTIRIPAYLQERYVKIRKIEQQLTAELERQPTHEEIAAVGKMPVAHVKLALDTVLPHTTNIPLSEMWDEPHAMPEHAAELDPSISPYVEAYHSTNGDPQKFARRFKMSIIRSIRIIAAVKDFLGVE